MIIWNSKWNQSKPTILHDILEKPKDGCDPPIFLIQMVLDIAHSVLIQTSLTHYYPLQDAIWILGMAKPKNAIRNNNLITWRVSYKTRNNNIFAV